MPETFYITTPLYYVNAPPHLGGTYTTIVCDTIARYKRMMGFDVRFLTGTDEHGQKIARSARDQGVEPRELAERVCEQYADLWRRIGISNDLSIRTTDARHRTAVQEVYRRAKANGFIYKGEYAGWYCVSCEAYAPESKPGQAPPCPDCNRETEWFSEESYFFKLSEFGPRLLAHYENNPRFIRPEGRHNEVVSFVEGGLRDLSISRATLKWGVPLPDDPDHVFYVWFDALTGYMTGIGYQSDPTLYEKYWPADLHVVGKDILRFHAVYWPAFLLAAELPLPKMVFGHGWWLFKDEKMSKSRGNVLAPGALSEVFGIEVLRYFMLREMVFGQDCNLSYDAIIQRANSDLANDLGNLLSRTVAMIRKYRNNTVPRPDSTESDREVRGLVGNVIAAYRDHLDDYEFSRALEGVWELVGRVNKYIVENEPWSLVKQESMKTRLDSVLFHCAESLRISAVLLAPIMPQTAQTIWEQLGLSGAVQDVRLDSLAWSDQLEGVPLRGGEALFPRLDPDEVYRKLEDQAGLADSTPAAGGATAADSLPPLRPTISIDDFQKLDLRVGTVVEAENVKGADKLLRLVVDLGFEKRQVLAGIAETYAPESLVGRRVVVVANLKPRRMRGLESNGMIVAASVGAEDRPVLVGFQEDVVDGAQLR